MADLTPSQLGETVRGVLDAEFTKAVFGPSEDRARSVSDAQDALDALVALAEVPQGWKDANRRLGDECSLLEARVEEAERRLEDAEVLARGRLGELERNRVRAETAEREVERLGMQMYEECVPKGEANKRIAEEQEIALGWVREEKAKRETAERERDEFKAEVNVHYHRWQSAVRDGHESFDRAVTAEARSDALEEALRDTSAWLEQEQEAGLIVPILLRTLIQSALASAEAAS